MCIFCFLFFFIGTDKMPLNVCQLPLSLFYDCFSRFYIYEGFLSCTLKMTESNALLVHVDLSLNHI
ncbi:hypothetical protein AAHE18_08G210400 [Arachis hypogaea]